METADRSWYLLLSVTKTKKKKRHHRRLTYKPQPLIPKGGPPQTFAVCKKGAETEVPSESRVRYGGHFAFRALFANRFHEIAETVEVRIPWFCRSPLAESDDMLPLPLLLAATCDVGMVLSATSIAAYLIRKRRGKTKTKTARASPSLRAVRDRERVWAENYTDMHPADFRRAYGVDKETFDYILGKVDHDLSSKYPQYSRQGLPVTSGMKVAMALRWLRTDRDSALECIFKVGRCVRCAARERPALYCRISSPPVLVVTARCLARTCRRVRPRAARAARKYSTPRRRRARAHCSTV
jgi:hypothetical protein